MKKILIAGGSGLVGQRLLKHLPSDQYHVHILSRSKRQNTASTSYFQWDLNNGEIDTAALKVDTIINLTGAGIADQRWSDERKKILIQSRVDSARLIAKGLKESGHKPQNYIGASAIGFYGNSGDQLVNESSPGGSGFLGECCSLWEAAHEELMGSVEHFSMLRIGIVLAMDGGALPKMLMTRKLGVFNYFGNGKQYYSWIHIDDLCRMFVFAMENQLEGVFNAVAPNPLTNKALMEALLESPGLSGILIPAPAFALKLAMGEMSAVVLDSCNASADKITQADFVFEHLHPKEAVEV